MYCMLLEDNEQFSSQMGGITDNHAGIGAPFISLLLVLVLSACVENSFQAPPPGPEPMVQKSGNGVVLKATPAAPVAPVSTLVDISVNSTDQQAGRKTKNSEKTLLLPSDDEFQ